MNVWGWTFLLSNAIYWGAFLRSAGTGPRGRLAIAIGVVHMLLATVVSVAPFRSFFDPHYLGFSLGLLRFEGRAATLPSTVLLVCALTAAWLVVSRSSGRGLMFVTLFDLLFALNAAAGTIAGGDYRIQFGDGLTIDGIVGLAIMLLLFAGAPLVSAGWAWRQHVNPA